MHTERDPRVNAIPDIHGHAKGEHKPYADERPLPLTARMLFLWFYHACRRGFPRFMMVTDHMNYLTFEDPAAVNLVRRALKLAQAGDLYGAAETANVEVGHAQVVSEGLRRGMRYSIGAEVDNDPRCRPDAQNIVDAMRPDGMVRSVHFITIEHPIHGPNWSWPFDNPEFASLFDHVGTEKTWELYMAVLLDAIERLPGQIVGHFYVPAIFGHWPPDATLEQYEDRMLAAVAARGNLAVEFNTRFLYRESTSAAERAKYLAANTRLLRKAKERGIGIAIGSDAHSPRDQGGEFATVLAVLDQLEINEIVFPIAGRLLRVALRVIKPPEPEPVPEPEPAAAGKRPRKARPEAAPTRPPEPVRAGTGRDRKPRTESAAPPPPARAAAPEARPRLARPAAPPAVAKKRPTPPPSAKAPAGKPPSITKAAPAKKAPAKPLPPAKKAPPPKKAAPLKAAHAKGASAKAAPKKAPASAKKAAAPVRKIAPKKAVPAKKAPAKKTVAKSASVKKPVRAAKTAGSPNARAATRPAGRQKGCTGAETRQEGAGQKDRAQAPLTFRNTLAAAGLGLLVACTPTGTTNATGGGSSVLRIAVGRSPNTLNPILAANTTEAFINRLSFDNLISVDPTGRRLIPILATEVPTLANHGISTDGRTITYHLHAGVRWQDGVPFSSRDVAFTWRAIMSDANNVNSRNGYDRVASVDTPNGTTVIFHLKAPFAPFVNTVFAESDNPFCILPEHLLGKEPNLNRIAFNSAPIGTGPYKVVRWDRGDRIDLVANRDYFRGAPKIGEIVIRDFPDENTSINALRTHDVDWMFEPSPLTITALRPLAAAGTIRIVQVDMPQTLRIYINTSRPYLRDVRIRQAVAYAIDKRALVDRLTGGTAIPATADQPTFSPYYEPNVVHYAPDPGRARALLRAAGYTVGATGPATKNGQPATLQLALNVENATRRNAAVQLQAMLRAAGIDAPVKTYPGNLYFATFGQGGILTNAKYDLGLAGWIAGIDPDDYSLYGCDQNPPRGNNYDRYCSTEMQALQQQALGSYDEAVRKRAYSAIQKLLARDVPDLDIWYPRQLQPIVPSFKHFAPNPINEGWNAYQWEI